MARWTEHPCGPHHGREASSIQNSKATATWLYLQHENLRWARQGGSEALRSLPRGVLRHADRGGLGGRHPALLDHTCKRIGGPWGHEFRDACWANVIEAALPHHRQPAQSNTLEKGRHMVFHLLCLPTLIFIKMQVVFSSSSPQSSVLTSLDRDPSTWSQSATSQNRSPCLTQRSPPTLRLWSCASRWPC